MSVGFLFRLIGFYVGAFLHVYLISVILRQEIRGLFRWALFLLVASLGAWHLGNALRLTLDLSSFEVSEAVKRSFEILAYAGLGILPSALLITYRAFPAYRRGKSTLLAGGDKIIGFILLSPIVLLPLALRQLAIRGESSPMDRLREYLLPFIIWLAISVFVAGVLSVRLSRNSERPPEKELFRWLSRIFWIIAVGLVLIYIARLRELPVVGGYLETLQMLSSIAPTSLVAYHIYRYNYLDLVIRRRLVYGLQISVLLMLYFAGIRQLSEFFSFRYGLSAQMTESLLISALLAVSFPVSLWIDRFIMRRVREYREFVTQLNEQANSILDLAGRIKYIEDAIRTRFEFRQVCLVVLVEDSGAQACRPDAELLTEAGRLLDAASLTGLAESMAGSESSLISARRLGPGDTRLLMNRLNCNYVLPLRFERRMVGCLLVDSYPLRELGELEDLLLALSGQIAASIVNGRLLESKLRLEREMARQEHLVSLGRVAATMAHEVRNPLGSIKTLVQLMREEEEVAGRHGEELQLIDGQIDRLNRTVTQLLSFSRPQRQAHVGSHTANQVCLEDLLQSTAAVVQKSGGTSARCRFEISIPPNLPPLAVDGSLLQEVFLNLFLNAVQAGQGPCLVKVSGYFEDNVETGRSQILLEVMDDGPGIPEAVQPHIFDAFYTTRQSGTGLGLYIVKRNVEALGGTISFRSPAAETGGTVFQISFPLRGR